MTVTYGEWRIAPYQGHGNRCWQIFHGKSGRAMRYYDDLGDALLFCAQYDLRNKVEGDLDVAAALGEWRSICDEVRRAVSEAMR